MFSTCTVWSVRPALQCSFFPGTHDHAVQSCATTMAATGLVGPLGAWHGVSATEELDVSVAFKFNSFKLK